MWIQNDSKVCATSTVGRLSRRQTLIGADKTKKLWLTCVTVTLSLVLSLPTAWAAKQSASLCTKSENITPSVSQSRACLSSSGQLSGRMSGYRRWTSAFCCPFELSAPLNRSLKLLQISFHRRNFNPPLYRATEKTKAHQVRPCQCISMPTAWNVACGGIMTFRGGKRQTIFFVS